MGSGRIHIESLLCNGTESNLLECGNSGVGVHDCSHLEDAGVICPGKVYIAVEREEH